MNGLSLKKRLALSFLIVASFSALLCSGIYSYFLMEAFKNSLSQKVKESTSAGMVQVATLIRELQTYTDLISSDTDFGQVLSFDSPDGIETKVKSYHTMSKADLVIFIPRPQQYVSIRSHIFSNAAIRPLQVEVQSWATRSGLLKKVPIKAVSGWVYWNQDVYVFSAKPVLHFGNNMGAIVVANKIDHAWAVKLANAIGAEFLAFFAKGEKKEHKIFSTSLKLEARDTDGFLTSNLDDSNAERILTVGGRRYIPLFQDQPVQSTTGVRIGFLVSVDELEKSQLETLKKVLILALGVAFVSAFIGFLIARAISNPLQYMATVIQSIGQTNDLGKRVVGQYKAEIGILANAFNQLVERLQIATDKLASSEKRMKDELTMASTVQEMLFPAREYNHQNVEISSFIQSSTETGGDWFDYFTTEDGNHTVVLVGDVTGHGMPAALITAIMTGFSKGLKKSKDPLLCDRILENLNSVLLDSAGGKLHMTFFVSVLNHTTHELRYANAGHNRPFICHKSHEGVISITTLPSQPSQRLGETYEVAFVEEVYVLNRYDSVIFYTDGLLECSNKGLVSFGKRRLLNKLKEVVDESAHQIKQSVIRDAFMYFDEQPLVDDITLVVLKICGPAV